MNVGDEITETKASDVQTASASKSPLLLYASKSAVVSRCCQSTSQSPLDDPCLVLCTAKWSRLLRHRVSNRIKKTFHMKIAKDHSLCSCNCTSSSVCTCGYNTAGDSETLNSSIVNEEPNHARNVCPCQIKKRHIDISRQTKLINIVKLLRKKQRKSPIMMIKDIDVLDAHDCTIIQADDIKMDSSFCCCCEILLENEKNLSRCTVNPVCTMLESKSVENCDSFTFYNNETNSSACNYLPLPTDQPIANEKNTPQTKETQVLSKLHYEIQSPPEMLPISRHITPEFAVTKPSPQPHIKSDRSIKSGSILKRKVYNCWQKTRSKLKHVFTNSSCSELSAPVSNCFNNNSMIFSHKCDSSCTLYTTPYSCSESDTIAVESMSSCNKNKNFRYCSAELISTCTMSESEFLMTTESIQLDLIAHYSKVSRHQQQLVTANQNEPPRTRKQCLTYRDASNVQLLTQSESTDLAKPLRTYPMKTVANYLIHMDKETEFIDGRSQQKCLLFESDVATMETCEDSTQNSSIFLSSYYSGKSRHQNKQSPSENGQVTKKSSLSSSSQLNDDFRSLEPDVYQPMLTNYNHREEIIRSSVGMLSQTVKQYNVPTPYKVR